MIEPLDYKTTLDTLPLGSSIKIPHVGCTESNAMKVWHKVEGFQFFCFKCSSTSFYSMYNSPRERLRRQQTIEANREAETCPDYGLPVDFSRTLPVEALQWLGSGGWTLAMMELYNIGWSEKLSRVILPVSTIGYTGRSVNTWNQPKYLERVPPGTVWESCETDPKGQSVLNSSVVSEDHSNIASYKPGVDSRNKSCVLCEDILSAGRCGNYIKAYSLLGTSLDTQFMNVLKRYKTILIWLDPDRGGISGVKSMFRRLHLICDDVRVIHSEVDPKLMPDNEIKDTLCTKVI